MAVFGPVTSERRKRDFAVVDLEWIPARRLPQPQHTLVKLDGVAEPVRVPLPVSDVKTEPLKVRLASVFDMVPDGEPTEDGEDPVLVERFSSFPTVRELVDEILTRQNRGRWFYAHAGGLADMEFVLDELLKEIKTSRASAAHTVRLTGKKSPEVSKTEDYVKGAWKIRASFSGSSAIIIHVARGKNAWHFVDSYWLLRDKLANIGKALKIGKGDSPEAVAYLKERFDKDKFDQLTDVELETFYREAPIDVLLSYNRTDCEILWKAIRQFEAEIWELGGQLQMTIASTGMQLIRRSYLKNTIYTSERLNKIAEETYYASRVEVISRDVDDLKVFDINSSFPYAMTFPQPGGLAEIRTSIPDEWLEMSEAHSSPDDPREARIFLADVTIEVPDEMVLPPIPYRQSNRVFFPVGRWRAWLTSVDIRLALREGCKLHKVHEVYVFEPFLDLRSFANDVYARRAAADTDFRKLVLKYLLNAPYGKFAEQILKQEMLINPDEVDRAKMQLLQPGVWLQEKEAQLPHRHVPISTHITAIARRTLYDYAKECYAQFHQLHYCDTDSLATRAELSHHDTRLGALKLEKKLAWAQFIAPKIYRGEGLELKGGQWVPTRITRAKGFSLGKSKDEAWERFDKIASGDRVGIQRMTRMRELYRSGETEPMDILVIKALTFEMLSKRFHYPDGETRPWHIRELVSGEVYPKGFDFEPEFLERLDTTTRAMIGAAV